MSKDTEVKEYLVTPVKNRFIPDIIKNGRIEEPGIYKLNRREVWRASNYGYLVEEIDPDNPPVITDDTMRIGDNKIGMAFIA